MVDQLIQFCQMLGIGKPLSKPGRLITTYQLCLEMPVPPQFPDELVSASTNIVTYRAQNDIGLFSFQQHQS